MRLRALAPGVRVATAQRWATTTTVVDAGGTCLVVDPALTRADLAGLARELAGHRVVAAFSTHPHWDHLLWHRDLGDAPRWATPTAARHARRGRTVLLAQGRAELGGDGLDETVFAQVTALEGPSVTGPTGEWAAVPLPWTGPEAVVVPYGAHAPGSAALVVAGVLVAGDVLSDREVPLLDPEDPDPLASHLAALDVLEAAAADLGVRWLVPGHGTATDAAGLADRLAADRAYLTALAGGRDADDPRLADPWVRAEHLAQVARLRHLRGAH